MVKDITIKMTKNSGFLGISIVMAIVSVVYMWTWMKVVKRDILDCDALIARLTPRKQMRGFPEELIR
jgi:hypothetical protein